MIGLQIRNGEPQAPNPVGYLRTDRAGEPLQVSFYHQSDPPTAVVTFGERQEILFVTQSGSGTRYSNDRADFRERHGEAAVTW